MLRLSYGTLKLKNHISVHFDGELYLISVVAITLAANAFHFFDLTGLAAGLDVFEVNVSILTEVDNGSKEVVQTLKTN